MRVIRAQAMGMCFGVRDALAITDQVQNPEEVTIHGELVHNEQVNQNLKERGFNNSAEVGRKIPDTPVVMITAHGVSNVERSSLARAGKQIIDTTCPLVKRAHDTAVRLASDGWHVVVAGKRGHVEVLGLTGDLDEYTVVESPEEAFRLHHPRIAIVCQTTLQPDQAKAIEDALRSCNPSSQVRLFDTICRPTRERQSAMKDLLKECDAIVVVGGQSSNNTLQLVRLAEAQGKPVMRVNSPDELNTLWAASFKTVGLTAGTSTPDELINAVQDRLMGLCPPEVRSPVLAAIAIPLPQSSQSVASLFPAQTSRYEEVVK